MRLLIAEDDNAVLSILTRGLSEEGYVLDSVARGDDALHMLRIYEYSAAILDWRMPGMAGDEVVREARRLKITTPILMLTARDTLDDKVLGLDSGADDYLVKPVMFEELLARLRALLRRPRAGGTPQVALGNLTFDPVSRSASVDGRELDLTLRELSILEVLIRRQPAVVERMTIARQAWEEEEEAVGSNTIDVHVSHLRRKLAQAGAGVRLITVRGVGHRLVESAGARAQG